MNPTAPSIKDLIKVHKTGQPIRPVVNWRNTPAYHIARFFTLKQFAPLPNTHNIENTKDLLHRLKHTPIFPHYKLASLDMKNLYTNIPVKETKDILAVRLKQNDTDPMITLELLNCYDTITTQNYFRHNNNIQIQREGLAMGAPSSGIISEIFLQHIEHLHLTNVKTKLKIIAYF
jgi:hypothetical protein